MNQILSRAEIPEEQKWDLTPLFTSEEAFEAMLEEAEKEANELASRYQGKIQSAQDINQALAMLEEIEKKTMRVDMFAMLNVEADTSNKTHARRSAKASARIAKIGKVLAFLRNEIAERDAAILQQAAEAEPGHARFLQKIAREKRHMLAPDTEEALAALDPTLSASYQIYNDIKFGDTQFASFEANGRTYEMTYAGFENRYESDPDPVVRHRAAEVFYQELARHKNGTAATYNATVQNEKILATLRGYDSVFDYLLDSQDVTRELYDRQIDTIMQRLAPIMRRYAKLLGKVHHLPMTTYDLKMELDPTFVSKIRYEEAEKDILEGLSILGEDYVSILQRAFDERWIDYAENRGKRNGAFCASVYGVHPYILSSFNHQMDEVATLAHELGHAVQSVLTDRAQSYFDAEMSMYLVEAPSTTNELIMENYLLKKAGQNLRQRRWVIAQMISKTYYHNFVTHLLEACYQREVYRMVDAGGFVYADILCDIYRKVLTEFWGDAVEIKEGSTLTWMRQPHYFMGLYSYTYSAGLTIGTQMALRLMQEEETAVEQWHTFLAAGGSKSPVELASLAGVDITTQEPLNQTIDYIGSLVDELEKLTDQLA